MRIFLCGAEFRVPDSLEVDEVSLHLDAGNRRLQNRRGALQFALVMLRLGCGIAAKPPASPP